MSAIAGQAHQRGLGLVELLIAAALSALLLGTLLRVTTAALQSQAALRDGNKQVQEARFALGRVVARIESAAAPPAGAPANPSTTGSWLAPLMFCLDATGRLIETTTAATPDTADATCTGSRVIAERVTRFSVERPLPTLETRPSNGPFAVPAPAARVTLAFADALGRPAIELAATVRLGGAAP